MKNEEHDELWDLLGKAREPKVPAFFASKVLRAAREDSSGGAAASGLSFWAMLRARWIFPVATAACAGLILIFSTQPTLQTSNKGSGEVTLKDPLAEMAAAAADNDESAPALDALIAAEDHSIWLEADPSSLY